ncbi:MAG: hypothetical protein ACPLKZ_01685 [Candidatus Bathyarchaeales archaeon]
MEAIDEALSSLGESVKTAVYFHLEHSFNIKRQEIPNRLADFSEALERIFGPGARRLEVLFMKSIHSKIKVICKWPEYEWPLSKWLIPELTFQDYVKIMQQKFEATQESKLEMGVLSYEREPTSK